MTNLTPDDAQVSAENAVKRIAELTRNTRTTWFSLLGVLLFVGITLLGFQHIDFYGYGRQTSLPLIGVSVPTRFFFLTAPLLVAANFIYFHLYLIRLWDALGEAPAKVGGMPLGQAIPPWLITDAALWLRNRMRQDGCTDARPLEGMTTLLNFAVTWGFGLLVAGMSWWLSAVARDVMMTGLAALALSGMILTATASFVALWHRMVGNRAPGQPWLASVTAIVTMACLAAPSYFRTVNPAPWMAETEWLDIWNDTTGRMEQQQIAVPEFADRETGLWDRFWTLAEINLEGENIVERPGNWLPYNLARADFERTWCAREVVANCGMSGDDLDRLSDEFWDRQDSAMALLQRPDWHLPGRTKPDFRGANLRETFLVDIDLAGAQLQGADLSEAELRGADLSSANLQWASLEEAEMQGSDLEEAALQWADLSEAKLQEATIEQGNLQMASLQGASLQGASLEYAAMQMAKFGGVNAQGTNFRGARMQGADFSGAQMQGTMLIGAQMQTAIFDKASMQEADLRSTNLQGTRFNFAKMQGANLRFAWMQGARLGGAMLQDADLSFAKMQRASFNGAQMQRATLQFAILTKDPDLPAIHHTSLDASTNNGGALKNVDLSNIRSEAPFDWRNTFLDGSVQGQDTLLRGMNLVTPPCQWQVGTLNDDAFFGHWRGWIEANPDKGIYDGWNNIGPVDWKDVTPIPPPPGCTWATDSMPGMPSSNP